MRRLQPMCIMPAIDKPDIQKAPGTPCRHRAGGCAIYELRPQICRDYHCGWRWLAGVLRRLRRPDLSGVFVELEADVPLQSGASIGMTLILVGNPLKTVRQHDFQDFVARNVRPTIVLLFRACRAKGHAVRAAAAKYSRHARCSGAIAQCGAERSEKVLKRLSAHAFKPHAMEHAGHDLACNNEKPAPREKRGPFP